MSADARRESCVPFSNATNSSAVSRWHRAILPRVPPPLSPTDELLLTEKHVKRRILRLSSLRAQVDALDIYADRIP